MDVSCVQRSVVGIPAILVTSFRLLTGVFLIASNEVDLLDPFVFVFWM